MKPLRQTAPRLSDAAINVPQALDQGSQGRLPIQRLEALGERGEVRRTEAPPGALRRQDKPLGLVPFDTPVERAPARVGAGDSNARDLSEVLELDHVAGHYGAVLRRQLDGRGQAVFGDNWPEHHA